MRQTNNYKLHELITGRKSIRAFDDMMVDNETLKLLFEAARWAPSSMNEQPWRFIVAKKEDPEAYNKMLLCLNESNRIWASKGSVLILTLVKKTVSENNHTNRFAWHDAGLAIANLTLQATSMGLYMHQMGGFDAAKTAEVYSVPDEFEPVSISVVGYKGDAEDLPVHLKEREIQPRHRKPLSEIVYSGKFGTESTFIK